MSIMEKIIIVVTMIYFSLIGLYWDYLLTRRRAVPIGLKILIIISSLFFIVIIKIEKG